MLEGLFGIVFGLAVIAIMMAAAMSIVLCPLFAVVILGVWAFRIVRGTR